MTFQPGDKIKIGLETKTELKINYPFQYSRQSFSDATSFLNGYIFGSTNDILSFPSQYHYLLALPRFYNDDLNFYYVKDKVPLCVTRQYNFWFARQENIQLIEKK